VGDIINFKMRPINKDGGWRRTAMAIATALHVAPEALWPEHLQAIEAKKTETHLDVTVEQFGAIANGEKSIFERDEVKTLLALLPARQRTVIEMRYGLNGNGEHTGDEVAEHLGFSRARAYQLELKALERMRRPNLITGRGLDLEEE
jgi:DNA-directed RNA polymerase sigma subunit (sigma70/sigma32)